MENLEFLAKLGKYLKEDLSPDERDKFEREMEAINFNIEKYRKIWEASGKIFDNEIPDKEKIWAKIDKKTQITTKKKKIQLFTPLRIAAGIAVLITLSLFFFNKMNQPELQAIQTGEVSQKIILPDGTSVHVNANSIFTYPKKFTKNTREVRLTGEAFFEVAKDKSKPFIIKTDNAATTVLGTSFNLKTDESETKVTVLTGKVKLASLTNADEYLILTKGEAGIYKNDKDSLIKLTKINADDWVWKIGKIEFNNTQLQEVCKILSANYFEKITIADSAINTMTLTANFENNKLTDILSVMAIALDIEYDYKKDRIVLKTGK